MTTTYDVHDRYVSARQLLEGNRPLAAAKLLEPAVRQAPEAASLQVLLGIAAFRSSQLDMAEAAFGRVLELDPTDHYAHFALGRTLERRGRNTDARRHFRLAAALDPSPDYAAALERAEARCAA